MKFALSILFGVAAAACTALLAADEKLVKAKDGSGVFGYKTTPKLPWCEWLVHDPDRPVPPKLKPGTPVASSSNGDANMS